MTFRRGRNKLPRFNTAVQTRLRTAPKRTSPAVATPKSRFRLPVWAPYTGFTLLSFVPRHAMFHFRPMPKRILIVEDEVSVRTAIRTFLEHHSRFEVCGEAANGVEALEKAAALRPDLIVLDLSMPVMNGVEVASLLRAKMPLTPVVVYTMFDDVLGKSLTATLGIAAIVSKPDGLAKLLARIEALLESPTLVQPPAA